VDARRRYVCAGGHPPRNGFERVLDRYTSLTAPFLGGCVLFPVLAAVALGSFRLGVPSRLWLAAAYFLVFGGYCLANFTRCHEAHRVVTGGGWSALGVVSAWGALTGHDIRSDLWNAFIVIAIIGFAFESAWKARRGTIAFR
jgi:hypothetical protein